MIYTPFGLTVLKVGQIKSEYKDLKPQATSLIAESRRAELMYRLYSAAKIRSPLLEKAPDPLPKDQSGIKPDSDSLPVPDSGVGEMPTPEAGQ